MLDPRTRNDVRGPVRRRGCCDHRKRMLLRHSHGRGSGGRAFPVRTPLRDTCASIVSNPCSEPIQVPPTERSHAGDRRPRSLPPRIPLSRGLPDLPMSGRTLGGTHRRQPHQSQRRRMRERREAAIARVPMATRLITAGQCTSHHRCGRHRRHRARRRRPGDPDLSRRATPPCRR